MAKRYSPNQQIIEDSAKAAACGLSYGKWVEAGRPEPLKSAKKAATGNKSGCRTQCRYQRKGGKI